MIAPWFFTIQKVELAVRQAENDTSRSIRRSRRYEPAMGKASGRKDGGGMGWPQPLSSLVFQSQAAAAPFNRHLMAFYSWEAGLRLLATTAIAEYAAAGNFELEHLEELRALARPSTGDWWSLVKLLVPVLAERVDPGFATLRDSLLSYDASDQWPALAGLDSIVEATLPGNSGKAAPRATVSLAGLFDHLVTYRNQVIAHGATASRPDAFHAERAEAFCRGMQTLWREIDPLAGRRLVYVTSVRRLSSGAWKIERCALHGNKEPRTLSALEVFEENSSRLPVSEQAYLIPEQESADPRQRWPPGGRCTRC